MIDVLAQIDHALAVQDATAYGDAEWLPGDPLHRRPRGSWLGEQTVRPMFELIDNEAWYAARCEPCQVRWAGDDPCWVCGTDRPLPGRNRSAGDVQVQLSIDTSQYEAALARLQEQMREFSERFAARLDEQLGRLIEDEVRPQSHHLDGARWSFVPAVANPSAPTVAELADAGPIEGLFVRPDPEPVLDERLTSIDPAQHMARPVTIRAQDPDDTTTRRGFFGELTLPRPRYPRPTSRHDNQENR